MPVQLVAFCYGLESAPQLVHLNSCDGSCAAASLRLKAEKDRGMAQRLNEIHLPKIYSPALKPKRKNAASTYSRCSLYGWLASRRSGFCREGQRFIADFSPVLVLLVRVKCPWREGWGTEGGFCTNIWSVFWGFWERGVARLREMWKMIANAEIPPL